MKSRLPLIFAGTFITLLMATMLAYNHQKPRMMIVHSFSEEGQWEKAVDRGIRRELGLNLTPISTRWHYMAFTSQVDKIDWKAAGEHSQRIIDGYDPHVLVTIGEEAQDYVGRHYAHRPGPRLVYAMGEDPASFGYVGAGNVTGINEVLPLKQIVEVLRHTDRAPLRIRVLGMNDATGRAERQQVESFPWAPHTLAGVRLVPDFAAWQDEVLNAADDADVLIVLSFNGLPRSADDPRPVDHKTLATWTEQHSRPLVIAVRVPFVAAGGALAVAPSAEGLGQQLTRHALAALIPARNSNNMLPPPKDSVDFLIALRPGRLAERQLALPAIYTQAARASHTLY